MEVLIPNLTGFKISCSSYKLDRVQLRQVGHTHKTWVFRRFANFLSKIGRCPTYPVVQIDRFYCGSEFCANSLANFFENKENIDKQHYSNILNNCEISPTIQSTLGSFGAL